MSEEGPSGGVTPSRRQRLAKDQLVRVDGRGAMQAAGKVAAAWLREREGAFRMLPSPGHVIFLRLTGEDGRRDEEDGAVVRLAGEIAAPGTICDLLALVGQSGWRGELVIFDSENVRSIFFDKGNIVGAQTSVEAERIGMILWRHGVIDAEQHAQVMERVRQGARFGQTAIELGFITREQLFAHISKQLEEILFPTFALADGAYYFLDDFDESRLVARHTVSATALLMDGLTKMDEVRYFSQKIPSTDFIPERTARAEPGTDLRLTWSAIDGKSTIEEIGRKTGLGDFATTKAVFALLQSKHVLLHPPRSSGGAAAVVTRANAALRLLHQRADAAGKGTSLRESLRLFLVSREGYGPLLESGADEDGSFDPQSAVAGASRDEQSDPEQRLKALLHEYSAYALFTVGSLLGASQEAAIAEEIDPILQEILPQGLPVMTLSVFLALMVLSVGGLLFAYARELRWLVWITKPLASTVFVIAALAFGATRSSYGLGVLVALLLSWLGDVLLIPKDKRIFLAGILAFLAGHLAFGAAFLLRGVAPVGLAAAVPLLVLVGVPVGRWLVPQVTPSLKGAVVAYIFVLSGMVALAAATFAAHGNPIILLGAVCFYLSDLSVALDRFVAPGFRHKVWGTPLYFGAQLLFATTVSP